MKPPTPDSVARDLAHFVHPTQFVELRALHVGGRGRTFAGWFDGEHLHDMARHALALARQAAGVYFTPNPVSPILAAKRLNRVLDVHKGFALTHDSDVVERRYLVIDLDPARLHFDPVTDAYLPTQDVPTTARELAFALRVARGFIRPFLADLGFPDPVTMLSGNGVHLAYRIDSLPGGKVGSAIDPAAKLLALLHDRYSCAGVTVDANTYNPCRMLKVPGTTVRRGEPTRSRPHRTARIIEVPNGWLAPAPVAAVEPAVISPDAEPERKREPQLEREPDAAEPGKRPRQARPGVAGEWKARKPAAKRPAAAALFDAGRDGRASH